LIDGSPGLDLIAEEAYKLPTTIGQRLACKVGKPWVDIDMNDVKRIEASIYEQTKKAAGLPLIENGAPVIGGVMGRYVSEIESIREDYWVHRLLEQRVSSAIVICGSLHLASFAQKLRERGCAVVEIPVWERDWYKDHYFGTFTIFEGADGGRWFEFRPRKGC
jgi:hypothetical protein